MPNLLLEFLTVFSITILPQILAPFYPKEISDILGKLQGRLKFLTMIPSRISPILLILYIAAGRYDAFDSIGLNFGTAFSPLTRTTALLLTGYLLLIFVVNRFRARQKDEIKEQQLKILEALHYLHAEGYLQRLLSFVDLWLAVVGEELVYRGYLILLLGRQTGSFLPWIILSLILSVLVHLYQGRNLRMIFTHFVLASLFILAVMVTKSLFAALIPHLIYNTVWLIRSMRIASTHGPKSEQSDHPSVDQVSTFE